MATSQSDQTLRPSSVQRTLRRAFCTLSRDKDDELSSRVLKGALQALGLRPTDNEIQICIQRIDTHDTGTINFEGINDLRSVMGITGRAHSTEELDAIMKELDMDGDGVVTQSDFFAYMKQMY
ncbi:hypothetical protein B0O99DRAFT_677701 [Bisporella sp. PMI_857]|nr:hypothetical protein B0O99DRAFT_677701 [Bisporella sp. PMI_857]